MYNILFHILCKTLIQINPMQIKSYVYNLLCLLRLIHSESIIAIMLWYLLFCYILSNFIGSSNAVRQNNILTRGLFSRYDGFNPPGPVNGSWAMHWFWQSRDHFHEPNDEPNWRQRYWERYNKS